MLRLVGTHSSHFKAGQTMNKPDAIVHKIYIMFNYFLKIVIEQKAIQSNLCMTTPARYPLRHAASELNSSKWFSFRYIYNLQVYMFVSVYLF